MSLSSSATPRGIARLSVERLEDRTNPVFLTPNLSGPLTGQITFNGVTQPTGGVSVATGDLYPDTVITNTTGLAENEYVLGTGPGIAGTIGIFGRAGNLRNTFQPFGPGFTGGLNVAVGDVLGDSQAEIIVAPASNALPVVGVFTPQGQLLSGFLVFDPLYRGGLNIAVGNVANGIGAGGFNGGFTTEYADFIESVTGTRPRNQFKQEIVIGSATASSRVVVTDGAGNVQRDFFAFPPTYNGGVTVAAGSIDKRRDPGFVLGTGASDTSAYDEIIVGAASVAPYVRIFSVWEGGATVEQEFFAFPPNVGQGVNVAATSTDGLLGAEVYVTLIGSSALRVFDPITQEALGQTFVTGGPTPTPATNPAQAQLNLTTTNIFPGQYSRVLNLATGVFFGATFTASLSNPLGTTVPSNASYDPVDDDTFFFFTGAVNPLFLNQDLAITAGDGPFNQQPRLFVGGGLTPAPFNGPPPP